MCYLGVTVTVLSHLSVRIRLPQAFSPWERKLTRTSYAYRIVMDNLWTFTATIEYGGGHQEKHHLPAIGKYTCKYAPRYRLSSTPLKEDAAASRAVVHPDVADMTSSVFH